MCVSCIVKRLVQSFRHRALVSVVDLVRGFLDLREGLDEAVEGSAA